MKRLNIFAVMTVAFLATLGTLTAQEKYAVIITGNMHPDSTKIPVAEQWNGGQEKSPYFGYDTFWKETFLAWEMLVIHKNYPNDNVHVLFGDGHDFTFTGQDQRYKVVSHGYMNLTDAGSDKQSIASTFAGLAGAVTDTDTLLVWVMSHGGADANGCYFYSYDNQRVSDNDLATWLGNIPAHKKVVYLSFPKSGAFASQLEDDGTIVITSGGATEGASQGDGWVKLIF